MRGVRAVGADKGTFHALKFMSSSAYSPSREIDILKKCCHPNIISVVEVFAPAATRKHTVMVMEEMDFNMHEYLQRSRSRVSGIVLKCLATQMLAGLEYIHARRIVHRDLKPQNILLSVMAPDGAESHPSCLRLRLADFSRARIMPDVAVTHRVTKKTTMPFTMSPGVTTTPYAAPEVLRIQGEQESDIVYGQKIDVWSFGTVLFEISTSEVFVPKSTPQECLASIVCRLGPALAASQGEDGDPELARLTAQIALRPLASYRLRVTDALVVRPLRWSPSERPTASELLAHCCTSNGLATKALAASQGEAEGPSGAAGFGEATLAAKEVSTSAASQGWVASASASSSSGSLIPFETLGLLSKKPEASPIARTLPLRRGKKRRRQGCQCAGHCYTPGHRYYDGCDSKEVCEGSDYCVLCICEADGCARPRLRGVFCYSHARVWGALPWEIQATRAMRHDVMDVIPSDISGFLGQYTQCKSDLCTLLLMALIKEATPLQFWAQTGVPGKTQCLPASTVAESLTRVLKHSSPMLHKTQAQQVSRQGHHWYTGSLGVVLQPAHNAHTLGNTKQQT